MQDHDPVGGNIKDYAVDGVLRRDSEDSMGDFGSCDDIQLGFDEIKKLASDTYANATWVDALSAVNGIYLVLDNSDGRMYVGSAYGGNGIFGRWAKYAKTGHGGNKELKDLDPRELEFSILEIAPPNTFGR